jgi:glutathione reductase (NADPH)
LHADGRTRLVTFANGSVLEVDTVMYCIGRTPNVDALNLAAVGVAQAADGAITVDAYSRTSVAHIFAIGDVTNRMQLTPVAIHEGQCFADTAFGGVGTATAAARAPDYVNVPSAGIHHAHLARK